MDEFAQTLDEATGGVLSEAERQERQAQQQVRAQSRGTGTVGDALGPVLDAEKTDIQFWLTVAQTILLLIIARELRR